MTFKSQSNYLKLSVRASIPLHDGDAVARAESGADYPLLPHDCEVNKEGGARVYVTTFVYPFKGERGAKQALAAAQLKRSELRATDMLSAEAFQLSTWLPSGLRGVPVIGEPLRQLKVVEAA